jgi:cytosine/adenosine deaminase-related metal-dependent hydrolase
MSSSHRLVLFAKYLLTLDRSRPIEDAFVLVQDGKIVQVGRRKDLVFLPSVRILDLEDTVLLPGFINSHCHLDFTRYKGKVPRQESFREWLRAMGEKSRQTTRSEFKSSVREGIQQSLAYGSTTLCDVATSGESIPLLRHMGLRAFWFLEILDLGNESPRAYWKQAFEKWKFLAAEGTVPGLVRPGFSPHTPFTVSKETLGFLGKFLSSHKGYPTTLHLAESQEEWNFFRKGKGPMANRIKALNPDWNIPRGTTPVQYLNQCGWLPKLDLAVHVNQANERDLSLLAKNRISVVHCPGSHAFFNHPSFPYQRLVRHRIPVCLGTDSLASNSSLSLFREMRLFKKKYPQVPSSEILTMVTTKPARALGLGHQLGRIKPGFLADLIGIPAPRRSQGQVGLEDWVLRHRGHVTFAMIQGELRLRLSLTSKS